jgi:hypothetical protein
VSRTSTEIDLPAAGACFTVSQVMRTATFTSMLIPQGTPMGAWVAACVVGEPFGIRLVDQLNGI